MAVRVQVPLAVLKEKLKSTFDDFGVFFCKCRDGIPIGSPARGTEKKGNA